MRLYDNLACLRVFILTWQRCLALENSLLAVSNRREVWGVFSSGHHRWSTPFRALTSSSEWKVHDVLSTLSCVSWRFPLVGHHCLTCLCRSLSGFLRGMFQAERRRSFIWRISYFCEWTSQSFFRGPLSSGVSNETVPFDRCSPEDMLLEFEVRLDVATGFRYWIEIICSSF